MYRFQVLPFARSRPCGSLRHDSQKERTDPGEPGCVGTKWLEAFFSLADAGSSSRSAQLRHVTQPAFSRRIQALEAWAGLDLVDRSSYPTRLTPAGETFHGQALEVLGSLQSTRNMMRAHQ